MSINWGHQILEKRGYIECSGEKKNAVGMNHGSYGVYRALSISNGNLTPDFKSDFSDAFKKDIVETIKNDNWYDKKKIVTMDPFGTEVKENSTKSFPSIAITNAMIEIPEIQNDIKLNKIKPDGNILLNNGKCKVTKAAIDQVWYLPGVSDRIGCSEDHLRECLVKYTNGMYPELLNNEYKVFLPPIGGMTVYMFGDVSRMKDENTEISVRVHDECNGSDVFGSDICTCRPYLVHGLKYCIETAQKGGVGIFVYFRKEGRSLGEVSKYLVYNVRKSIESGDSADKYFERTCQVCGLEDARFQEFMPDVLHWLGISKIDNLVSMSNLKYDAIVNSGISVKNRIPIPFDMIPDNAHVEINAKISSGYLETIFEDKLLE